MTQITAGERPVIALGTFDGLHPGHRQVIHACVELAREMNAPAAVYTFLENPKSLFGSTPKILMSNEDKERALLAMGINEVCAVHFTAELAALSPEAFIEMLLTAYRPSALVAGEDYSFGKNAEGDSTLLLSLCRKKNILCRIIPLVRDPETGEVYSSTRVREALESGDAVLADKLLRGSEVK